MKPDFSHEKTAIFIGSSVCVGSGATNNRGWSTMMAERMERNGWTTSNCAIGGQTTADILLRLQRDVIDHHPAVCIVGLGLSNEGLSTAENLAVPCGVFLGNLKKIVQALEAAGIFPIVGGVYPNDDYTPEQYVWLRRVYDEMDTWDVPVLQWLNGIEDGHGHYPQGMIRGIPMTRGISTITRTFRRPCGICSNVKRRNAPGKGHRHEKQQVHWSRLSRKEQMRTKNTCAVLKIRQICG